MGRFKKISFMHRGVEMMRTLQEKVVTLSTFGTYINLKKASLLDKFYRFTFLSFCLLICQESFLALFSKTNQLLTPISEL